MEVNRVAAAGALAKRTGGNEEWRQRLTSLLREPASPEVLAAGLEALAQGWPDHVETRSAVEAARRSLHDRVFIAGADAAVRLGMSCQDDLDPLVRVLFPT